MVERSVGGPRHPPAGCRGGDGHAGRVAIGSLRRPRRTLVLGGARSGKSSFAEELLARRGDVDYVACGLVPDGGDAEWTDRVALHRARRPASWQTIETVDLPAVLGRPGPPVLLDCLTTWLARVMDDCGVWSEAPDADARLAAEIDALLDAWRATRRRVVAVSNEVGSGVVPATASGRRFRDELGVLNTRVAAASSRVWLVTAGLPRRLR
jgi:adenosylcobinamide kinase/adenosylcobinamide-phosphate guanylyltransferase